MKQIKIIYSLKSVHFLREVVLYPLQLNRKHRLVIVQDTSCLFFFSSTEVT